MSMVPINCWAVLVAAVASFILGWMWYGPLFGKAWGAMSGINMGQKPPTGMMVKSMLLNFIGALAMSFVLACT